jgi:hypothetical protein
VKTKTITINAKISWAIFVLAMVGAFGLSNIKTANAQEETSEKTGDCVCKIVISYTGLYEQKIEPGLTKNQCIDYGNKIKEEIKKDKSKGFKECEFYPNGYSALKSFYSGEKIVFRDDDVCKGIKLTDPTTWLNCIFLYVLQFITGLLSIATTIFTWVIQPESMTAVMSNPTVYEIWSLIRDTLNICFIMMLLFSAFCTVFQVEKFSYRKILLHLVLMALLVNFSFPIVRFIIDLSNVLMFYFLNSLPNFNASESFTTIADSAKLQTILTAGSDTTAIISAVIFTFILAVTLLIIAVLLLIRTIVLTLLIIFSPIAFTGSIVPSLSEHAHKWWTQLFNNAFFGPIMIFMLYIAIRMMQAIKLQGGVMEKIANNQTKDSTFVAAVSFYALPIIILWLGIGMAQSMGAVGAGAVVGQGKKFMGWAGRNLGGARPIASWISKKSGVPGAVKQRYEQFKASGILGSERTAQREALWAKRFGVKGAEDKDMKKRAEEYKKNNESDKELFARAVKGDAAAAYRLALDGKLNSENKESYDAYKGVMDNKHVSEDVKKQITVKARDKNIDTVIKYQVDKVSAKGTAKIDIAEKELHQLDPAKWKDQNIKALASDVEISKAAKNVYNSNPKNKKEITKNMRGDKYQNGLGVIW